MAIATSSASVVAAAALLARRCSNRHEYLRQQHIARRLLVQHHHLHHRRALGVSSLLSGICWAGGAAGQGPAVPAARPHGCDPQSHLLQRQRYAELRKLNYHDYYHRQRHGQQSSWFSSSTLAFVAGGGAAALSALSLAASGTDADRLSVSVVSGSTPSNSAPAAASCESPTSASPGTPSASKLEFQIMAALEVKEELQKVRLAQVVHDLKKMAAKPGSGGRKKGGGGIRRYVTMVFRQRGKEDSSASGEELAGGIEPHINMRGENVSLEGVDLLRITPDVAMTIITALKDGGRLNKKSIMSLISASRLILQSEPTLIDLRIKKDEEDEDEEEDEVDHYERSIDKPQKVTVVGDLHGSLSCLTNVLNLIGSLEDDRERVVVFDGDFVDRGDQSVEVLSTLLLLKLAYPRRVFLLRGNHEDHHVAAVYGFQDEVRLKYGSHTSEDLWDMISRLFACLPIAVVTPTALILHGGIPGADFELQELDSISPYSRRQMLTTMEDEFVSPHQELLTDIMWSDPSDIHLGVRNNPRGCGKSFGRDVAKQFLVRNQLQYLVRGHEPQPAGFYAHKCGKGGHQVLTVFSNAAYPGGQGDNLGAILTLEPDGTYTTQQFAYHAPKNKPGSYDKQGQDSVAIIRSMIGANRRRLEAGFQKLQKPNENVTISEWAETLSEVLELREMPWSALQPSIAPNLTSDGKIDWHEFLERNSVQFDIETEQAEILHENHEMLLTIFKYLDVDGNGQVGEEQFKIGVEILNKRLPKERQLQDVHSIFDVLDHDHSGTIDFDEFSRLFRFM